MLTDDTSRIGEELMTSAKEGHQKYHIYFIQGYIIWIIAAVSVVVF